MRNFSFFPLLMSDICAVSKLFETGHGKEKVDTAVEYTAVTTYSHWVAHNTINENAFSFLFLLLLQFLFLQLYVYNNCKK